MHFDTFSNKLPCLFFRWYVMYLNYCFLIQAKIITCIRFSYDEVCCFLKFTIFTLNTECRGTSRLQSELDYIVSGSLFLFHKVMQEPILRNERLSEGVWFKPPLQYEAAFSDVVLRGPPRGAWQKQSFCTEKTLLRYGTAFGVHLVPKRGFCGTKCLAEHP